MFKASHYLVFRTTYNIFVMQTHYYCMIFVDTLKISW